MTSDLDESLVNMRRQVTIDVGHFGVPNTKTKDDEACSSRSGEALNDASQSLQVTPKRDTKAENLTESPMKSESLRFTSPEINSGGSFS